MEGDQEGQQRVVREGSSEGVALKSNLMPGRSHPREDRQGKWEHRGAKAWVEPRPEGQVDGAQSKGVTGGYRCLTGPPPRDHSRGPSGDRRGGL